MFGVASWCLCEEFFVMRTSLLLFLDINIKTIRSLNFSNLVPLSNSQLKFLLVRVRVNDQKSPIDNKLIELYSYNYFSYLARGHSTYSTRGPRILQSDRLEALRSRIRQLHLRWHRTDAPVPLDTELRSASAFFLQYVEGKGGGLGSGSEDGHGLGWSWPRSNSRRAGLYRR